MNEENGRGYGCFVMFVAGLALLIALIALRKWDMPLWSLSSGDVNVVDILSILVTILIAGQLWQSMVTKEDLKKLNSTVNELKQLKAEIDKTQELPQGIMWQLRGERSQAQGTIPDNRLAIQFYAESLRHFALAQASFEEMIRNSLIGMVACIDNIINADLNQFASLSDGIATNINLAEESVLRMQENLREAYAIIIRMREHHSEAMRRFNAQTSPLGTNIGLPAQTQ